MISVHFCIYFITFSHFEWYYFVTNKTSLLFLGPNLNEEEGLKTLINLGIFVKIKESPIHEPNPANKLREYSKNETFYKYT